MLKMAKTHLDLALTWRALLAHQRPELRLPEVTDPRSNSKREIRRLKAADIVRDTADSDEEGDVTCVDVGGAVPAGGSAGAMAAVGPAQKLQVTPMAAFQGGLEYGLSRDADPIKAGVVAVVLLVLGLRWTGAALGRLPLLLAVLAVFSAAVWLMRRCTGTPPASRQVLLRQL